MFGMKMTKDQLGEFKKQFNSYQEQYMKLNQTLLNQNNIKDVQNSRDIHEQILGQQGS